MNFLFIKQSEHFVKLNNKMRKLAVDNIVKQKNKLIKYLAPSETVKMNLGQKLYKH